jgi:signal transduction histidine kinase
MRKNTVVILLATILFFSCTKDNDLDISKIVNQWITIENLYRSENISPIELNEKIDVLYQAALQFEKSESYMLYQARDFSPLIHNDANQNMLHESENVNTAEDKPLSELLLQFQKSVIRMNTEEDAASANVVSSEISRNLFQLLQLDGETQRYISSAYIVLFFILLFLMICTALIIIFLHHSLSRSKKREVEGTFFSHANILAQEKERTRISRELHDTVIQDIRYVLLKTEKIGDTEEAQERKELTEKTVQTMTDVIKRIRDICMNLIPPDFRFGDLPDAVRQLCIDFQAKTGIECHVEIAENLSLDFLSTEKRLQVYRIIQEALSNIEKHAKAHVAIITMRKGTNRAIHIGIGDDGIGFRSPLDNNGNLITHIDRSHIGIIGMKERAAIVGANLTFNTEEGEGTLVGLEIPCDDSESNENKQFY